MEHIGYTSNPRKMSKEDTVKYVEKVHLRKTPPSFRHTVDYEGDNNEKNLCTDDSHTENDDFIRNLDK